MTDGHVATEAESNTNWTRRSFLAAVGATGLAASTTPATSPTSAETTNCCSCDGMVTDGGIDSEELAAVIARLNAAADALEFPARRVGASVRGAQHTASHWGIHFRTDRTIHLGRATVDAGESGSFTAVVGAYDGENSFEPVHKREINVESGINEIDLDMTLEPGEYLLTRDGSFPLRRGEWGGWESQSRDGLELIGGSKPGGYNTNRYWYYFFDLNVAAHADAHL